jgi:hypothetical protein
MESLKTADGITLYRTRHRSEAKVVRAGKKTLVYIGDKLPEKHADLVADGYVYVNVAAILSVDTSNVKLLKTAKRFRKVLSVIRSETR